jgi:16S rRNA (adenine1518-N6/adenine1519-N6)-dimethyltransferase
MNNIFFDDFRSMRAIKHLGQNFLVQPHIIRKIITACQIRPTETLLEIGPGKGALTTSLVQEAGHLIAVETDQRFADGLAAQFSSPRVKIIHADILKLDLQHFPPIDKVIGNLPYNIAAPIIFKLLENIASNRPMYFTVQWEFGRRLSAQPRTKDYGSLSCFIQYQAETRILFTIPAGAFKPIPKVTSCFVEVVKRAPKTRAQDEQILFRLIRQAFSQRRKMLVNSLAEMVPKEMGLMLLTNEGIPLKSRAEDLSIEDYVRLANRLVKEGQIK